MAELVGLLASVAGVATAGLQISALLYKTVQEVRGLSEEITTVARDVKMLSAVFGELSDTIRTSRGNDIEVSVSCRETLADLVKDSRRLYGKIGDAVEGSRGPVKVMWFFRRQDVELWKAEISKNISVLNLLITTLVWAETRRRQMPSDAPSKRRALNATGQPGASDYDSVTLPRPSGERSSKQAVREDEIPVLIERQVHETVLCAENLARMQEQWDASAIRVQFSTDGRPDLEPRRYLMQQQPGAQAGMRRESFDSRSFWLSEIVTIGDASALAGQGGTSTYSADDRTIRRWTTAEDGEAEQLEIENRESLSQDRPMQMLADRLVQGWTNMSRNDDTEQWEMVLGPDEEAKSIGNEDSDRGSERVQEQDGDVPQDVAAPADVYSDPIEITLDSAWKPLAYEQHTLLPYEIGAEELRAMYERRSYRRIFRAILGRKAPPQVSKISEVGEEEDRDGAAVEDKYLWRDRGRRNALVPGTLDHQLLIQHQHQNNLILQQTLLLQRQQRSPRLAVPVGRGHLPVLTAG